MTYYPNIKLNCVITVKKLKRCLTEKLIWSVSRLESVDSSFKTRTGEFLTHMMNESYVNWRMILPPLLSKWLDDVERVHIVGHSLNRFYWFEFMISDYRLEHTFSVFINSLNFCWSATDSYNVHMTRYWQLQHSVHFAHVPDRTDSHRLRHWPNHNEPLSNTPPQVQNLCRSIDTDLGTQEGKSGSGKSFSKNICNVLSGRQKTHLQSLCSNKFTHKMKCNFYMLHSVVKNGIRS